MLWLVSALSPLACGSPDSVAWEYAVLVSSYEIEVDASKIETTHYSFEWHGGPTGGSVKTANLQAIVAEIKGVPFEDPSSVRSTKVELLRSFGNAVLPAEDRDDMDIYLVTIVELGTTTALLKMLGDQGWEVFQVDEETENTQQDRLVSRWHLRRRRAW